MTFTLPDIFPSQWSFSRGGQTARRSHAEARFCQRKDFWRAVPVWWKRTARVDRTPKKLKFTKIKWMEAWRVVAVKLTANSQWCCTFRKRKHPAGNCSICRHHRLRDGWEAGKGLEGREERTWSRSPWRGLLELINRFIWTLTGETLRPLIPRSPAGTLANVNALIKMKRA